MTCTIEEIRAMNQAVREGDLESVKVCLTDNEELLHEEGALGSLLHTAAFKGHLEVAKYLLMKGLPINIKGGPGNNKPICNAVAGGHKDIVEYFLMSGADVDVDHPRANPLFDAILDNQIELARILIETGMDISLKYTTETMTDMSACDFAKEYGREEIVKLLVQAEQQKHCS